MLRELARQALEAHQRAGGAGPHRRDEVVQRRLATGVARESSPTQHLQRHDLGLVREQPHHQRPERLRLGRATDRSPMPLERVIDRGDLGLLLHGPHRALGDSRQARHLGLCMPGPQQDLNLVPLHHPVHPFPRLGRPFAPGAAVSRRASGSAGDRQEFPEWMRSEFSEPTAA